MKNSELTIVETSKATDLNRLVARASLGKSAKMIGRNDFYYAAKVMGKELTNETDTMLMAITASYVKDTAPEILDWLNALGDAICE